MSENASKQGSNAFGRKVNEIPHLKRGDFSYDLPEHLIAQYPEASRSNSRLLCLDSSSGRILDKKFADIVDIVEARDLLVFNDTRVVPARLNGTKETGGKVEILVERVIDNYYFLAQLKMSKKPKVGSSIIFNEQVKANVVSQEGAFYRLRLSPCLSVSQLLEEYGHVPLPPYIKRHDEPYDQERYQTIYSVKEGAVAAPTAGLHFDEKLFLKLEEKGIETAFVTLHVGAGTFQPVRCENLSDHTMHREMFDVSREVVEAVQLCKRRGGKVIAVGTTVARSLESSTTQYGIEATRRDTDLFIYPGYEFKTVDAMITNFHVSESTLLMMVSALAGKDHIFNAYQHAIKEKYRFHSYGDAMFIG